MVLRLVRITFVVRLVAIAASVAGMVIEGFDPVAACLAAGLAVTSVLGLRSSALLAVVVRRPVWALPDIVLIFVAVAVVGWENPLALVGVSSAFIIGLLFPVRMSAVLSSLLVAGHVVSARTALAPADLLSSIEVVGVLVSQVVIGGSFRIAARHQAEALAEAAEARAAAAAAEERLRLARELHDTVAKSVQGVALAASALPSWIERDAEEALDQAHHVARGARDAVLVARSVLGGLRLDDPARHFDHVLVGLVETWHRRRAGAGRLHHVVAPVRGLSPGARHELLAAVAEALENVARHAPDAGVTVAASRTPDGVVVRVADDGPGFDDDDRARAAAQGRYGLVGIEERLRSVGGRATVTSTPRGGTTVVLRLPPNAAGAAAGAAPQAAAALPLRAAS